MRFKEGDIVWPEMTVFIEAALARWATDDFAIKLSDDLELFGVQCPCLVLHNAVMHQQNLRTSAKHFKNYKPITEYIFTERAASADESVYRVYYDDQFYLILQQIVFGHAFERLRQHAVAKWGPRRNWPDIVQFGYHIRNGSFHGNRFHFTMPIMGSPTWRGITITPTLEGVPVMGRANGVLGFADIPLLLHKIQRQV